MAATKIDPKDPIPLYYQIYKILLDRIEAGEFLPGSKLPSWRKLVEEYGVSSITIIKALDMLERHDVIIRKRGTGTLVLEKKTRPASDAMTRKSIIFFSGALQHPSIQRIMIGACSTLASNKFNIFIVGSDEEPEQEKAQILAAVEREASGLIIYPVSGFRNQALFAELKRHGIPIVMVDRFYPEVETDVVINDDEGGSYQLTKALIERGHRRIAVLQHYEVDATSVWGRITGYRKALEDSNLHYDENLLWLDIYSAFSPTEDNEDIGTKDALLQRIEQGHPTAFLAINYDVAVRAARDLQAIGKKRLEKYFWKKGHKVNVDGIDLALFQNVEHYQEIAPCHFVIGYQSQEKLGIEAANIIMGRLAGRLSPTPCFVKVPIEIKC